MYVIVNAVLLIFSIVVDRHNIGIATDLVCVIAGIVTFMMAGGAIKDIPTIVGVGTIITAFFMGPLIEFFNVHVTRPLLKEKDGNKVENDK